MKTYRFPSEAEWTEIITRPAHDATQLNATVAAVLARVRAEGDAAVKAYEQQFDHVQLASLAVSEAELAQAETLVAPQLRQALEQAHRNICAFHEAQRFDDIRVEVMPGITCWQRSVPIERVGLYIPGGTAPLFSTVLMLATPARIAGCSEIVLCTPPARDGSVHPAILVAARIAGVSRIFKIGGVQAIGAMAYGTESVPAVNKIFGPGNQYVTCAKQQVSLADVAIDMPAGPSEVEVLADATARPDFIAADLLSQAEHGADSQVLFVTTDADMLTAVQAEVQRQLALLPRHELAAKSLEYSRLVLVRDMDEALRITNRYAPEHLIIETADAEQLALRVRNAGSIFIGHLTPESAGDYASGTNHTLPTKGYAKMYSGVNLDAFNKKITYQQITPEGIRAIAPIVELMAEGEQLDAHARAMAIRRNFVEKEM